MRWLPGTADTECAWAMLTHPLTDEGTAERTIDAISTWLVREPSPERVGRYLILLDPSFKWAGLVPDEARSVLILAGAAA